ncbi:hypothetical protein A1Q1_01356 [Trichosporon asahii var. asahii CBS 2479]|uniref:Uncharacterized protein n=1 Tax=Trichosporon asahii var. asahii (strain ATCC 90039 / CBS 2479 / JCM 2466 / KCTC 7840 / NBRC 103889/ NCYC 2677 / UAMH 7654) TaxID=1186058 RepID=J5T7B9_TRIAS|nr:hypothetical protein A1Q1_01356 [Trichosporon asahii var. asahii CBS 2479]EJT49551.1 hypothetical protein A1Q1_01356 [Trichosporon asahii var. asahii CBS 2479]
MPPADPDAELLARFAALKAPATAPGSTDSALAAAKAAADAEDAFLDRIARGDDPSGNLSSDHSAKPPPPPSSHPSSSLANSQAVSGSGGVDHVPPRTGKPGTDEPDAQGGGAAGVGDDDGSLLSAIRNSLQPGQTSQETPFSNASGGTQPRGDRGTGMPDEDEIAALRRDLDPENDRRRDLSLEINDALKVADGARRRASLSRDRALEGLEADTDEPEETEDEIIQRALEEASLEAQTESAAAKKRHDDSGGDSDDGDEAAAAKTDVTTSSGDGAAALLSLPSLSSLPDPPSDDAPLSAEEQARMAALLGLKGPSAFPAAPKKAPGDGPGPAPTSFPGMDGARDADLDSWCGE